MASLEDIARDAIPWPARDANKYSRGKLVLVAGSDRYPGAAVLAARASQRMGAGYTEVITSRGAVDAVRTASPSLVVRALGAAGELNLPISKPGKPCAVCVGPGFDASDERTSDLVFAVLAEAQCPVVVDGGALSALCEKRALRYLERRFADGFDTLITPHGGEAKRLADAWGVVMETQVDQARALSLVLGTVVVLKGPVTVISDGEVELLMDQGTPALAKAGTGDVLAGMLGALVAQGVPAFEAAACATLLHAHAGAIAAQTYTEIGVCAEDVVDAIPATLKDLASADSR